MNRRIGSKLLLTYFVVLLAAFISTDVVYQVLSRRYLINETHEQLRQEGQAIAGLLSTVPLQDSDIRQKIADRRLFKTAKRFIDSDVLVTNLDKKIVYKSVENIDRRILLQMARIGDLPIRGYVSDRIPIVAKNGVVKGYVLIFARVKDVYDLNSLLRHTQLVSFLAAGIIAMLIGAVFERSITKPIGVLIGKMKGYSERKELTGADIKTGDEIQELDRCFKEMVQRLKQYDEQQTQFLQNTSHELKTPLMSIQGYAEAIKDGVVEGQEMEKSLDIIIQQSQRLKKTVEEIIYLTKLEGSHEKYKLEKVSLQDCLDYAYKSIKPIAGERGIEIETQYQTDHIGEFDDEKLTRAFINILSNAVRYAESRITISLSQLQDKFQIVIADDGAGFGDGEENKVFGRFYKGNKGNTGIGLSITKTIVEGHGGTIKAYGNSPKGAVFEILLPGNK